MALSADDLIGHVASADALPMARRVLLSDPLLSRAMRDAPRVGARNEPPYPLVVLTDGPGGNDRGLRWLIEQELEVSVYGDLDGSISKAELRRILYVALAVLLDLPERPAEPGEPVVTSVRSGRSGGPSPEPTGQRRYLSSVIVSLHPAPPQV